MRLEHYEFSVFAQAAGSEGADFHIDQLIGWARCGEFHLQEIVRERAFGERDHGESSAEHAPAEFEMLRGGQLAQEAVAIAA